MGESARITDMLQAWRAGDENALDKLTPEVYREWHRAAKLCMRKEHDGHTLQITALINELYLRLGDLQAIDWQSRAHFFAICARQMRRILIDIARAKHSHKRGEGAFLVPLDEAAEISVGTQQELLAVDEALKDLAKVDERKSQVVELRFLLD